MNAMSSDMYLRQLQAQQLAYHSQLLTRGLWGSSAGRIMDEEWKPDEVLTGEPIVGWRVWSVQRDEPDSFMDMLRILDEEKRTGESALDIASRPWLGAHARGTRWAPRKRLDAGCNTYGHAAPQSKCMCGAWAFKDLETLRDRFGGTSGFACGTVALWGRIVVTKHGYRAQHAYPQEIELVGGSEKDAAALSRAYGIPVVAVPAWERKTPTGSVLSAASWYGPQK